MSAQQALLDAAEALAAKYREAVAAGICTLGPLAQRFVDACDALNVEVVAAVDRERRRVEGLRHVSPDCTCSGVDREGVFCSSASCPQHGLDWESWQRQRCGLDPDRRNQCAWEWATSDRVHSCSSPATHAMEHRCICGELYPS